MGLAGDIDQLHGQGGKPAVSWLKQTKGGLLYTFCHVNLPIGLWGWLAWQKKKGYGLKDTGESYNNGRALGLRENCPLVSDG